MEDLLEFVRKFWWVLIVIVPVALVYLAGRRAGMRSREKEEE